MTTQTNSTKQSQRLRVGVIVGGRSSEKEISLDSGRNIFYTLDPSKYEGVPIFMDSVGRLWEITLPLLVQNTTADIEARLAHDAQRIPYEDLKNRVDFVYIGLHGKWGEDGCLQGLLELLDVPYSGAGVLGSALGMHKAVQRRLLRQAGIDVPKHRVVSRRQWESEPESVQAMVAGEFGYPCVVKPTREGCSVGLGVVRTPEQLGPAIEEALEWDNEILVEELLQGMEITVAVIGNDEPRAFPPTETPPKGDFLTIEEKFLPGEGENITPARLPQEKLEEIQRTVERAYKLLHLKAYTRFDGFVVGDRFVITEPNTLPGATPSSTIFQGPAEAGIAPMELIDRVIQLSLEAHRNKKGPLD
ncbi:MAG: D-alanine--D-alanine ligase [Anaerolineae bacterium]